MAAPVRSEVHFPRSALCLDALGRCRTIDPTPCPARRRFGSCARDQNARAFVVLCRPATGWAQSGFCPPRVVRSCRMRAGGGRPVRGRERAHRQGAGHPQPSNGPSYSGRRRERPSLASTTVAIPFSRPETHLPGPAASSTILASIDCSSPNRSTLLLVDPSWRQATTELSRVGSDCAGIRPGEWYFALDDGRCVHPAGLCRSADGRLLISVSPTGIVVSRASGEPATGSGTAS